MTSSSDSYSHDVAVVGFSLRFPEKATSPQAFWELLQEGRSVMKEVPSSRFNINGFYHPDASRNDTVPSYPFLVCIGR
jgi:acyl transferase domain-containing protein